MGYVACRSRTGCTSAAMRPDIAGLLPESTAARAHGSSPTRCGPGRYSPRRPGAPMSAPSGTRRRRACHRRSARAELEWSLLFIERSLYFLPPIRAPIQANA